MNNLDFYNREMREIAQEASRNKGIIGGGFVAWLMMIVGVIVTGTMTYSLTHEGMKSNALWKEWVDFAAILPVALLEGSALALVYGRHHWFRSEEQRRVANVASWMIWGLLAATSVVHFAFDNVRDETMEWLMSVYASYVLPLAIVGVPMLWKKLYDSAPESAMRVAVLEAEASLRSQLVEVEREQNALMIEAYREALDTPRVVAARRALFEQASIEHARSISGFIEGAEDHTQDEFPSLLNTDAGSRSGRNQSRFDWEASHARNIASQASGEASQGGLKALQEICSAISFHTPGRWFAVDLRPDHVRVRLRTRVDGREMTLKTARLTLEVLRDALTMERSAFRERLESFLKKRGFEL